MIKFAHIAPTNTTEEAIENSTFNMALAHVAEIDDKYASLFAASTHTTLLDNGAFENGEPFDAQRMVAIGNKINADILVLPDYPFRDWHVGWDTVEEDIEIYTSNGFQTLFVPQSLEGDKNGFIASIRKALDHPHINLIGLSILGCPNAGLTRAEILAMFPNHPKRFHILGMLDSVKEIRDVLPYQDLVNSWDSSAAVWYGLNMLSVKARKTKFKVPVDFTRSAEWNQMVQENIFYIEGLLRGR